MFDKDKTMTVAQLIKKLQKMDQRMPVATEGCDCEGSVVAVVEERWGGRSTEPYRVVLLRRKTEE